MTTQFLTELKVPSDLFELTDYILGFEEQLKAYNDKVSRAYFTVRDYHRDTMISFAQHIKAIEVNIVKLRQIIESERVRQYKSLLNRIKTLNEDIIKNTPIIFIKTHSQMEPFSGVFIQDVK